MSGLEGSNDFVTRAVPLVIKAIAEDNAKRYSSAYSLYVQSFELFILGIKHEKSQKNKLILQQRLKGYMDRAETLKRTIEGTVERQEAREDAKHPLAMASCRLADEALAAEGSGNYCVSLDLYTQAIEHLMRAMGQLQQPSAKERVEERVAKLMERAEQVKELAKEEEVAQRALPLTCALQHVKQAQQAQAQGDCDGAYKLYVSAISAIFSLQQTAPELLTPVVKASLAGYLDTVEQVSGLQV
jgi:hypothetical protein